MIKKKFGELMAMLQSLFGKMPEGTMGIYWNKFHDIEEKEFERAASSIIDTFKPTSIEPFPSIARFNDALHGDRNNEAILAVGAVKTATSRVGPYKSISFGDRAIHATINHFGGWIEICNWHDDEWKFNERKFIEAYKSYKYTTDGPIKLIGLSEDDYINNSSSYLPSRKEAIEKQLSPVQFTWNGYRQLIENKKDNVG